MESTEFDAALGGTENLPHSANSLKFAASRSIEIAAMTESILHPNKTKLIFQKLPVHMRRRVMSHNCKRLPRRLREAHLKQLKKSGLPPKQKRPSRKYRRRATNLLDEYNRRQRRHVWLETHIWHAKRFHMIERWGHRIAYRPCDKAFRACYRASSAHCLIQDISYYTPIQIKGSIETIRDLFSNLTSSHCGLGVCAKAYLNGSRKGTIHLYMPASYPIGFIGRVEFIWVANNSDKELWLFIHPSHSKQVESVLTDIVNNAISNVHNKENEENTIAKRRKISTKYSDVRIKVMSGMYNRFRLTGPKSHAVLTQTLKCVKDMNTFKTNTWLKHINEEKTQLHLQEKSDYWDSVSSINSPSQLPPGAIVGLVVKDPRLSRPKQRTKAHNKCIAKNIDSLLSIPLNVSSSPIWNKSVCDIIKENKITNAKYIDHITKTQLVPGEVTEDDPFLQTIPIVLIQRSGSQECSYKKIGYGSGWDIIIPSGYGLPFWLTFIMFRARSGGLRETESLAFEMGDCYMPPDSQAGLVEEKRIEIELKEKYFKRPPSKRVNYIKLAVPSPFICPWNVLLKEWGNVDQEKFFVLRDRVILQELQNCMEQKRTLPELVNSHHCLVPVYIQIIGKGNLKKHAMICIADKSDICLNSLLEPLHEDFNFKLRKQKRTEHKSYLKQMRRKRIKLRKKKIQKEANQPKPQRKNKHEPSDYVKAMRELWLPSNIDAVRNVGSKEVMGYLSQGAFSFSEAKSCGVGYVAFKALAKLLQNGVNKVLVRNTTSRKYRVANIQIIK
ncbi:ribonucleases P/MRP protein subunit POP1 [Bicyclus anynana]|uniref:Ribonucleases P/MRP protein subunit POP1 n=1 Tax=Bicyclus anynana TaxID=110368 RepID=A0A6J1MMN7_BICAN|nr:ribonucleases P/MRP protein subunit POP1 [Bicyclus anynana]